MHPDRFGNGPTPLLRLQHGTLQVWRIHHTIERGDGTRWRAEVDMHIVGGQGRFFPVGGHGALGARPTGFVWPLARRSISSASRANASA